MSDTHERVLPSGDDIQAMPMEELEIYRAGKHERYKHPSELQAATTAAPAAAKPKAAPKPPPPESLDGMDTAAMVAFAKSNPAAFLNAARPLLDRLTPAQIRDLGQRDPETFRRAVNEKHGIAGTSAFTSDNRMGQLNTDPTHMGSDAARASALNDPEGFLRGLGVEVPNRTDPKVARMIAESQEAAKKSKPSFPVFQGTVSGHDGIVDLDRCTPEQVQQLGQTDPAAFRKAMHAKYGDPATRGRVI